ncbi:MAG TPA: PTS fructose-like transporter subunit IIB, partial [Verrucomicrobium sp.]|nr:PTS fructose-like transporter subunit IIB [Verrucomicrobium sp.]
MKIVALTSCPTGVAHTFMAAEALKKAAAVMGHSIRVETHGSQGTRDVLSEEEIASADVVILATDVKVDTARFAGKPSIEISTSEAIRHTRDVIERSMSIVPGPELPAASVVASAPAAAAGKRLVAITSCPTGIAHTFMAAEALQKAAKALGHEIKVETQGSVGAKNQLTPEDIAAADAVVIAADAKVDT